MTSYVGFDFPMILNLSSQRSWATFCTSSLSLVLLHTPKQGILGMACRTRILVVISLTPVHLPQVYHAPVDPYARYELLCFAQHHLPMSMSLPSQSAQIFWQMISQFDQRSLINFTQFQLHHQGMMSASGCTHAKVSILHSNWRPGRHIYSHVPRDSHVERCSPLSLWFYYLLVWSAGKTFLFHQDGG